MASRVVLARERFDIEQIDGRRRDTEAAIEAYFAIGNPSSAQRLLGLALHEVRAEKATLLDESRRSSSMDVFAALEAAFRIDFLQRCYGRQKGDISRAFQELYRNRGPRVSLERDILTVWRNNSNVPRRMITDLTGAFKYRHWLAHGRYWRPRFPKLDYHEVYSLAEETLDVFPFTES